MGVVKEEVKRRLGDAIYSVVKFEKGPILLSRYAVESVTAVDPIVDELYEPYQYDDRQELIEAAVREKVDRIKEENDNGW